MTQHGIDILRFDLILGKNWVSQLLLEMRIELSDCRLLWFYRGFGPDR